EAVGAARVAGHHDHVAGVEIARGDRQVVRGPVGGAVLAVVGGLAVLADVHAQERVGTGVARPAPGRLGAAEPPAAAVGGVDQAQVPQLELLAEAVLAAGVEAADRAADRRPVLLARGDERLLALLDLVVALLVVGDAFEAAEDLL